MRVVVDLKKCAGHANCVMKAPEVFDIDADTSKALLIEEHPSESLREKVEDAVRSCPVQAITIDS